MMLDRDLFENEDDVKLFIELVQRYGVQNLALLKVFHSHAQVSSSIISGFLQRPLPHSDHTRAHNDCVSVYWECWRSLGALHGIFHGVHRGNIVPYHLLYDKTSQRVWVNTIIICLSHFLGHTESIYQIMYFIHFSKVINKTYQ